MCLELGIIIHILPFSQNCPFKLHFLRMIDLLESAGVSKFEALNSDLGAQIQHVTNVINGAQEFRTIDGFYAPNEDNVTDEKRAEKSKVGYLFLLY